MLLKVDFAELLRSGYLSFPAFSRASASSAVTVVVAPAAKAVRARNTETAAALAAASERKRRRFGTKHEVHMARSSYSAYIFSLRE
jgi:hypothetical protein